MPTSFSHQSGIIITNWKSSHLAGMEASQLAFLAAKRATDEQPHVPANWARAAAALEAMGELEACYCLLAKGLAACPAAGQYTGAHAACRSVQISADQCRSVQISAGQYTGAHAACRSLEAPPLAAGSLAGKAVMGHGVSCAPRTHALCASVSCARAAQLWMI